MINTPVDAIPDLSENQVIVFADWPGRSPKEVEDQVTYPLSVNLQGLAGVKSIRATSEFGFSMINIIFEDKVDFYFARERVLERLSIASHVSCRRAWRRIWPRTPPRWGRSSGTPSKAKARTWGGCGRFRTGTCAISFTACPAWPKWPRSADFPIEYQIDIDPNKLRAYNVTLGEIYSAVARSNSSVGGRIMQKGELRVSGPQHRLDSIAGRRRRRSSSSRTAARRFT